MIKSADCFEGNLKHNNGKGGKKPRRRGDSRLPILWGGFFGGDQKKGAGFTTAKDGPTIQKLITRRTYRCCNNPDTNKGGYVIKEKNTTVT